MFYVKPGANTDKHHISSGSVRTPLAAKAKARLWIWKRWAVVAEASSWVFQALAHTVTLSPAGQNPLGTTGS